jgi:hypothetical protein
MPDDAPVRDPHAAWRDASDDEARAVLDAAAAGS